MINNNSKNGTNKKLMMNTMNVSKRVFVLLPSLCIMMLTVNAHEDLVSIVSLRGSENQRSLQEDECSYLGGVGWYYCSDTKFTCEDGYTCESYSWVGVRCVKENCVDDSVDNDDENEDDVIDRQDDEIDDVTDDDLDSCWEDICSSDNDCNSGSQCFIKGKDSCACRDPTYSPDCVKSKEIGKSSDVACDVQSKPSQSTTPNPSQSPTLIPSQTPISNPSQNPTSNPSQTPTPKSKASKSDKSKKYKTRI